MEFGLVLTGGGARGAWQAGALRAVVDIAGRMPFSIVTGTSAGAINAAWLASHADEPGSGVVELDRLWRGLHPGDVFRTDTASLTRIGADWLTDLGLGGLFGAGRGRALLDTSPLTRLIENRLPMASIPAHLAEGRLRGVALSATSYDTGLGVTFFEAGPNIPGWERRTRVSVRARLRAEHVLASSAIPVFFPAVGVDGEWFGDGCVRLGTPLSPAIHLGAQRILALGVQTPKTTPPGPRPYPSKARVASLLLDALFMDALDADVERARRINRTLQLLTPEAAQRTPLHVVDVLPLAPSEDLGAMGHDALRRFPALLRHLLAGLGASGREGWDLVSYLAFEPAYTVPLAELGFLDVMARRAEIEAFLKGDPLPA